MPLEITFKESISNPESISSRTQNFGLKVIIVEFPFFFFSPEKPQFNSREK